MPDAHTGYGMPIGGVLFADRAIVPYAIGVDIGCGVTLVETDLTVEKLAPDQLDRVLEAIDAGVPIGTHAVISTARFVAVPGGPGETDAATAEGGHEKPGNPLLRPRAKRGSRERHAWPILDLMISTQLAKTSDPGRPTAR